MRLVTGRPLVQPCAYILQQTLGEPHRLHRRNSYSIEVFRLSGRGSIGLCRNPSGSGGLRFGCVGICLFYHTSLPVDGTPGRTEAGRQTCIGGDDGATKLNHDATVEIEVQNPILRFTRRVRRFRPLAVVAHALIIREITPECSASLPVHPANAGLTDSSVDVAVYPIKSWVEEYDHSFFAIEQRAINICLPSQ